MQDNDSPFAAVVAQLDRARAYEARGCRFDPCRLQFLKPLGFAGLRRLVLYPIELRLRQPLYRINTGFLLTPGAGAFLFGDEQGNPFRQSARRV